MLISISLYHADENTAKENFFNDTQTRSHDFECEGGSDRYSASRASCWGYISSQPRKTALSTTPGKVLALVVLVKVLGMEFCAVFQYNLSLLVTVHRMDRLIKTLFSIIAS